MLGQRIVTAVLLLPPVLALIWFAPTRWVFAVVGVAGLAMAWEWTALMGGLPRARRLGYLALTAVLLAAAWLYLFPSERWPWVMAAAAVWWLVASVLLAGFPENFTRHPPGKRILGVVGQFLLVPTVLGVAVLHAMPDGRERLLYTLMLIWVADTGAYFAGRAFGRHKLAPTISPGKSWEGAVGALVFCALWAATAGAYVFGVHGAALATLVALSLVVVGWSIIGDLTESMFKRRVGLKDSGNVLPGHGGVLDRVDSLLAAVPLMALGLHVTGL